MYWTMLVVLPVLRRSQDQFLRQKIERFFWRDFSGEELLPENSFLGQKICSILSNHVIS